MWKSLSRSVGECVDGGVDRLDNGPHKGIRIQISEICDYATQQDFRMGGPNEITRVLIGRKREI